jgi:hypothetical protein
MSPAGACCVGSSSNSVESYCAEYHQFRLLRATLLVLCQPADGNRHSLVTYEKRIDPTTKRDLTMVRVWYEPPPGGPRSHLNRGSYFVDNARTPAFVRKLQLMKPAAVIVPAIALISVLCYIPVSKYWY